MIPTHTAGPWRWEYNAESKIVHLVGGKPQYDLTIMDFTRWGMHRAGICLRDTAHDGMNLMHKLHERPDWIEPFPGREHHKKWCANAIHPDMQLMAASPELLAVVQRLIKWDRDYPVNCHNGYAGLKELDAIVAKAKETADKATGKQP